MVLPSGCTMGAKLLHSPSSIHPPPSPSFIPQTQVSAEKQKLRAMLQGLCRVLSDQESQFLSRFHHLCWRLEEQQCGVAAEMSWMQQCHAELQAKCQQPDGDLLRVSQNFAPESFSLLLAFIHREAATSIFLPSSPGCPNHLEQVLEPKSITRNTNFGPKSSIFWIFSSCVLFLWDSCFEARGGCWLIQNLVMVGEFSIVSCRSGSLAQGSKDVPVVF